MFASSLLLALQLSASASVTAVVASSDAFYRDREVLGVRYHQAVGKVFAQAGGMLAAENGLFPSKSGASLRHWAVAAGIAPLRPVRLSVIHGRFTHQRSPARDHAGLPSITYYTFVGAGLTLVGDGLELGAERLLWVPQQVSIGLNRWVFRFRSAPLELLIRQTVNSDDQAAYAFWSGTATLRPFVDIKKCHPCQWLRPIGVEAGWRPVPSYRANREVRLRYLAVGVFARVGR